MNTQNLSATLNLHTDFSYLNTFASPKFLSNKVKTMTYIDKEIICNGTAYEEKALNIIFSGKVRIVRSLLNNNVISYDLDTGGIFGIDSIICQDVNPLVIASAVGDTVIYSIHQDDISEQLKDINE